MNRRELFRKTPAAMMGLGLFGAMPAPARADDEVVTFTSVKAVPVLWKVIDPETKKPCRMWLETLRELDGTYRAYTRRLGDLGLFRKTPVDSRIHPVVGDGARFVIGGPEFYPRVRRALLRTP